MQLNEFLSRTDCTLLDADEPPLHYRLMTLDALRWCCRGVCVPIGAYSYCAEAIREWRANYAMHPHDIKLITVIDFPDGALDTASRVLLVKHAEMLGFDEADVVMPVGLFLSHNYGFKQEVAEGSYGDVGLVDKDLRAIVNACTRMKVKVIVETGYLSLRQIFDSAKVVVASGAYCWKTSTGREPTVTIDEKVKQVAYMRRSFPNLKIKAAGGIRTREDAERLHEAGADIFGISWKSLKEIVKNWK